MAGRGDSSLPRELEMSVHVTINVPDSSGASGSSSGASGSSSGASGVTSRSTGSAMDHNVALEIERLFEMIEQQQPQMESPPARDGFLIISRVREQFRNVRPDEYTPHYMPIGPYHWSLSSQRTTADEKSECLDIVLGAFSKRTGDDKKVLLGQLLNEMKDLESDASRCYSDRFGGMGAENDFLHMLLLDGCYLLACFADLYPSSSSPNNNGAPEAVEQEDGPPRTGGPAARTERAGASSGSGDARRESASASGDVAEKNKDAKMFETWYLLENQIPFFVVQRIYDLVTGGTSSAVLNMFTEYVKKLLQDYIADRPPTSDLQQPSHLLHLVHAYFTPMKNWPTLQAEGGASDSSGTWRWRRATEYCSYANVRFHHRKFDNGAKSSVLDVSLASGKLLVPLLRVDNNTWTLLRNLMALEEHHAVSLKRHVTAYCLFMSQLACTEGDVALLMRRGVVQHVLGSDAEVAAGFADLCKGVVLDDYLLNRNYLKPVWHELERRYRSRWHNLAALFRQTHGRNLWYFAAFVTAVIVFGLQVLQAFYPIFDHGK